MKNKIILVSVYISNKKGIKPVSRLLDRYIVADNCFLFILQRCRETKKLGCSVF